MGEFRPRIFALDIGNATVAGVNGIPETVFFPSFLSYMVPQNYEGFQQIQTDYHHVVHDGRAALVGHHAMSAPGADTLMRNTTPSEAWKRYVSPESFYCFLAAISSAYPKENHMEVAMATGAPLNMYQAHAESIRSRYVGHHIYTYNGHTRSVTVQQVNIFGEGREVLRLVSPEAYQGVVAVHEVGGRTWNVIQFRDGAFVASRTYDMGVERLLDRIPSIDQDPAARWELQIAMRKDKKHWAWPLVLEVVNQSLAWIENKVPIHNAKKHLLAGGGAPIIEHAIKNRYKKADVCVINPEAPEHANAMAYAIALQEMVWKWKTN